mmetsp:Transcript_28703/g.44981  ORF Transcript_28703/g.44981 Transcript_28703/m.44981 type:complete len:501 (+) Transcript_28703:29-1531(+)
MISQLPLKDDIKKIASYLKTSLGPKGKDKILINSKGEMKITNDGATIISGLPFKNIALTILRDVCKVQDEEVGDGTTTVCCLVSELVLSLERLISIGIHSRKIIKGFRKCAKIATETIINSSVNLSNNLEIFISKLISLTRTTLGSKILFTHYEHFSRIVIKAILLLRGCWNLERVKIIKKIGGSLLDSFIDDGYIIERKLASTSVKRFFKPKILLVNTHLDMDKVKMAGSKIRPESLTTMNQLEIGEQKKILDKCRKILAHRANLLISRQLIYDIPEQFFTNNGLMIIENVDFEGIETISMLTNSEILSTFDDPDSVKLGTCKVVEEMIIDGEELTRFKNCPNGGACTIILRGSSKEILDEAERSIHDSLCVITQTLKNPWLIHGAGFCETAIACSLRKFGEKFSGMEAVVYEECSKGFIQIPRILAKNAGLDYLKITENLIENGVKKNKILGVDLIRGIIAEPSTINITENSKQKINTILSAFETLEIIGRIDKMFVN